MKTQGLEIRSSDLNDKLTIFRLAGEDSSRGWDYAIPQQWCDQLHAMGIEHPGMWFAADCSGPAAFPKLRHIGEALKMILNHRSKANGEIFTELYNASYNEDDKAGQEIVRMIFDYAGNQILNEADAGFLDLQMVANIATEAFARGRKSARPKHILESELVCEPDSRTMKVVLHVAEHNRNEFVVHNMDHITGGYSDGDYFIDRTDAMACYIARCEMKGVAPF